MSVEEAPKVWMPLYVADWDADTRHLTPEEDGCYGRLVRFYWRNGPPANDDGELANIVGLTVRQWLKVRPRVARFFEVTNTNWNHKRVEKEKLAWTEKKRASNEKAKLAAKNRWKRDAPSIAQAMPNTCPSSSSSSATLDEPTAQSSASGEVRFSNLEFREKAVERMGLDWVASWLDPASWQDLPMKAIVARNGTAADRIRRELRAILGEITVESRSAAA